jgi:hypothetical protein
MKKLLPILFISLFALLSCEEENIAINNDIRSFIEQKYEGARILYAEKEFNGEIDVEIIHDNKKKDVKFNRNNNWINTTWDVAINDLPDAARESVINRYPDYRIDDVDYIETPSGDRYKVEMEKGEWDKTVFVTANGEILN